MTSLLKKMIWIVYSTPVEVGQATGIENHRQAIFYKKQKERIKHVKVSLWFWAFFDSIGGPNCCLKFRNSQKQSSSKKNIK